MRVMSEPTVMTKQHFDPSPSPAQLWSGADWLVMFENRSEFKQELSHSIKRL